MSALKRDVYFLKCLNNVKLGKPAGGRGTWDVVTWVDF